MAQTFNPLWLNFFILVLLQLAIFLAAARWQRWRRRRIALVLGAACLLGIPFGLIFDLLIGRSGGIFGYFLPLSIIFALANGALSYGTAAATAACLPILILPQRLDPRHRKLLFFVLCVAAIAELGSFRYALDPLENMFRGGAIILTLGELAIALTGRTSAIVAVCRGNPGRFAQFWLASAGVGLLYEIINDWFPVWHWSATGPSASLSVELLVVAFGYVVLFHPLRLLWQIRGARQDDDA